MTSVAGVPRIESLEEYEIPMKEEIRIYLKDMYARHYISLMGVDKESTFAVTEEQRRLGHEMAVAHLERFLHRMKQAPRQTTLRSTSTKYHNQRNVGDCDSIMERVQDIMTEWAKSTGATGFITPIVQTHNKLDELTTVDIKMTKATDDERKEDKSLYRCRVPHLQRYPTIFPDWPTREMHGWPDTHRVVVVDRFCGEAVLRGADIFVKGIVVADTGIRSEENVAVYAHVGKDSVSRGMVLQHYMGHCVFLGIGRSLCDRSRFFSQSTGLGIRMSALPYERAGPVLPPLSPLLEVGDLYAQNLPSIYVGKVLDPKPGDCIYDMCGAPGGKTSHLALLTNGQATIVMSDKSRSKVIAARTLFDELGCGESVYPLHVDATKCVESNSTNACDPNMKDILHRSRRSESDGLLDVSSFPPESFDKILLDPPCSALGLRPKLSVQQSRVKDLVSFANYQKRFIREAVKLLRPVTGIMTYSTCSIHAMENEANVRFLLDEFDCMELIPTNLNVGSPGLAGYGLNDWERKCCIRFDAFIGDDDFCNNDTIGFFIAKFRKKKSHTTTDP